MKSQSLCVIEIVRKKERNREIRCISNRCRYSHIHTHINASTINVEMKSAQSSDEQNFGIFFCDL